jgi:hypothetical protein
MTILAVSFLPQLAAGKSATQHDVFAGELEGMKVLLVIPSEVPPPRSPLPHAQRAEPTRSPLPPELPRQTQQK